MYIFDSLVQENGFGNFEAHGVNAVACNDVPVSCIQPEGSSFAEQIQRRGSFHYFA